MHGALSDPLVSRVHARLGLTPFPDVVDDASAHGTTVAGQVVTRPTRIEYGTPIGLGHTVLVIDAEPEGGGDGAGTGVLRPPRFGEPLSAANVEVNTPPTKPKPPAPPWMLMLMPLVLGIGMLAVPRSAYTLIYLLGYPVLMFGGYLEQRRRANKEHRESLKLWYAEVREVLDRLDHHADAQRARADEDHPDPPELVRRVVSHDAPTVGPGRGERGLPRLPGRARSRSGAAHGVDAGGRGSRGAGEGHPGARPATDPGRPGGARRARPGTGQRGGRSGRAGRRRGASLLLRLCCRPLAGRSLGHRGARAAAGRPRDLAALAAPRRSPDRWAPTGRDRRPEGAALLGQLAAEDGRGVTVCLVDAGAGLRDGRSRRRPVAAPSGCGGSARRHRTVPPPPTS